MAGRSGRRLEEKIPGPGAHAPELCPAMSPRAPAYTIGKRLGFVQRRPGPAPNAYDTRGGSSNPAYTIGARLGYLQTQISPGPANYFLKDIDVYLHKQPAYSLGNRLEGGYRPMKNPGPAAYPPDLYNIKKCPYVYSFGLKHSEYAPPMIVKEDTMDCL